MGERERWMLAVQARLDRVTDQDLSPALEEAALTEAQELARTLTDDPGSLLAMYLLGWLHWARFHALGKDHGDQDLQRAMTMFTPCFIIGMSGLPEPLLPLLADRAALTAEKLLEQVVLSGDQELLSATVDIWHRIVTATEADHPGRAERLSNLGAVLHTRYDRTGAAGDLDAATTCLREAVQATPADHPKRAAILSNLGAVLHTRFRRAGTAEDLDAAITCLREAVQATPADHPKRAAYLSYLGNSLHTRYDRTGAAGDLDAAITCLREAVQATPADDPDRSRCLSDLGAVLHTRYDRTRAAGDLDAAIEAGQQAAQATPADHPDRARQISNLAVALHTRFERAWVAEDLDAAITCLREAVQATPADHPKRAAYLSYLGNSLHTRYDRTGAAEDLDAAIEAGQQAAQATPADHPDRARRLSDLGNSLRARFLRTRAVGDLDAAIDAGQQAVQAAADDPKRAAILSNLASAQHARFLHTRTAEDLDAVIEAWQQAAQATPADHPSRAMHLSNLGAALRARFERTRAVGDLDAAIEAGRQAVQVSPADHPNHAVILSNLGAALRVRSEHTGAAGDRDAAFQMYTGAANVDVATASARIDAGRAAALLVAETDPERAASLLEAAVLLLPEVAPRFLERGDQQFAIGRFAGLAADAAAATLSDPATPEALRPARALRLLEAARGVMLSQALSTRGDLSELRERHPELAARFIELRDQLDRPSPVAGPYIADLREQRTSDAVQRTIWDRRRADAEFTHLLARIRSLEGFGAFALPPATEQLKTQAEQGPVVVFNVTAYRSDAILLTGDGITSQRLPGLNQATVIDQINAFYQALDTIATAKSPLARVRAQEAFRQVLAWLWDKAAAPVLHALGYQEQPSPGQPWPQLWWVPGGLLSLLPIHAAGHHTSPPDPGHRTVMDRVISSYTPTVGALAHARNAHAGATLEAASRSLIVAMPTTPDLPDGRLTYVPAEVALLQARLPHPTVLTEPPTARDTTVGQLPTKAVVLEHLPSCTIAHFACHGHTDLVDPSQSRLLLHDHRRDPLTVAALAPIALDHAQLAYLSACGTARVSDADLLDEAIHLTSAFQLAGFPHVIGTLWEIDDAIAVEIADTFYTALTSPDDALDPHRAARALHHATRTQRDRRPATPYLWASHIHAGA